MRNKRTFAFAVILSVMLHLVFVLIAVYIRVVSPITVMDRTKRLFNVKTIRGTEKGKIMRRRGISRANAAGFNNMQAAPSMISFDETEIAKDDVIKPAREAVSRPLEAPAASPVLSDKKTLPPPSGKGVRKTRTDLIDVDHMSNKPTSIMPPVSAQEEAVSSDFIEKMPGFTPSAKQGMLDSLRGAIGTALADKGGQAIGRSSNFGDLEGFLMCDVSTYQDPSDGEKYFKIGIRAGREAGSLPTLPKEIIFLLDCSLSIQAERLEQFKRGVYYCLKHLNPGDYVNVIAFREQPLWLWKSSVHPGDANIKAALSFIDRLSSTEVTDAYEALHETIKTPEVIIPSYIVLFSDGRPTSGITNSKRIINEVTRFNGGKRPIFAFSGGVRVNRYFLDFISYKNRGWAEYADRSFEIAKNIGLMYDKIKDPILVNMRYRASGLDENEICPRSLPDFFRNAEFTLYGKYTGEDKFSFQFLGDAKGETNEFMVIGSLNEARKGDAAIARNWAFNRIYYLIGLLEYGRDDSRIINEINALCRKFNITTPYTQGIKE
ncbi:MAG: VWA domain-containing protein [Candidatus Omnitrophica bacterium]|nr:VWA domain-containing protein [Candidatus Omnitrophota bacterium]